MKVSIPGPGDHYAELYESDELPERRWRMIKRLMLQMRQSLAAKGVAPDGMDDMAPAQQVAVLTDNVDVDVAVEFDATVVAAFVRSWSLPDAVTPDTVLDLPAKTLAVLTRAAAPLIAQVLVDTSPTPEADSPT